MTLINPRPGRRTYCPARCIVPFVVCMGLAWAEPAQAGLVISVPTDIPATAGATDTSSTSR